MPIVSGGGGGGGPAAGSYLPVADKTGVTVDTITYNDTIKGSGKLTTLVFPASPNDQGALAIALLGDTFPRWLLSADPTDFGLMFGDGSFDAAATGTTISLNGTNLNLTARATGGVRVSQAADGLDAPQLDQVSPKFTIVSGAFPTSTLASGTGGQFSVTRDVETHTPVTFNPGVATTATCTVALSPDNVTYSTLAVVTKPVGTVFDGEIDDIVVRVPAGWYLKLAVVNATLGTTTYY